MGQLTRREREIARLVVDGKTNAVIARITGISIRTVEGHLYQIYAKLQVRGRADLTRLAVLPLVNLSADSTADMFANVMAEATGGHPHSPDLATWVARALCH